MNGRLAIPAGFVLIVLGFVLVGLQIASENPPAEAASAPPPGPELQSVVVAGRALERGEVVTADALTIRRIEPPLPAGATGRTEAVVGRVAARAIAPEQIMLADDLVDAGSPRGGLAPLVPEGLRGVALTVTDRTAVGNFVRPDDIVDVNVLLPASLAGEPQAGAVSRPGRGDDRALVLLQGVRVLAAGDSLAVEEEGEAVRIQTVTLALDPRQALRLGLAARLGSDVFLTLRHPRDHARVEIAPLEAGALDGRPDGGAEVPAAAAPEKTPPYRDVIVVSRGVATSVRVPVAGPPPKEDARSP